MKEIEITLLEAKMQLDGVPVGSDVLLGQVCTAYIKIDGKFFWESLETGSKYFGMPWPKKIKFKVK